MVDPVQKMPSSRQEDAWLRSVLFVLTKAGAELSLPQLAALLVIALEPGLSVNDLAERLGIPQQSASRNVAVLLGRYETHLTPITREPLIFQAVNTDDPRKRALYLSESGREFMEEMVASGRGGDIA